MRNIYYVIKHEIACTIGKPVFWLTTFVLPLVIMVFSIGTQYFSVRALTEEPDILNQSAQGEPVLAIGYVDHAGFIHEIPAGIPAELIVAYPDTSTARQAMDAGELSHYYVIQEHFVETGDLLVVAKEFSPLGDIETMNLFQNIVTYNLTGKNALASLMVNPIQELETFELDAEETGLRKMTRSHAIS